MSLYKVFQWTFPWPPLHKMFVTSIWAAWLKSSKMFILSQWLVIFLQTVFFKWWCSPCLVLAKAVFLWIGDSLGICIALWKGYVMCMLHVEYITRLLLDVSHVICFTSRIISCEVRHIVLADICRYGVQYAFLSLFFLKIQKSHFTNW